MAADTCQACPDNTQAETGSDATTDCQCNAGTRCVCRVAPACCLLACLPACLFCPALSCFVLSCPRQSRSAYFRGTGHARSHAPPRAAGCYGPPAGPPAGPRARGKTTVSK
jgi:hypothetical protein